MNIRRLVKGEPFDKAVFDTELVAGHSVKASIDDVLAATITSHTRRAFSSSHGNI